MKLLAVVTPQSIYQVSPTLFNVTVLSITVEDESIIHDRLGIAVVICIGVFYADYGLIGLRDPEWLQVAIDVLIKIF